MMFNFEMAPIKYNLILNYKFESTKLAQKALINRKNFENKSDAEQLRLGSAIRFLSASRHLMIEEE
jgi:hypothetical protein